MDKFCKDKLSTWVNFFFASFSILVDALNNLVKRLETIR